MSASTGKDAVVQAALAGLLHDVGKLALRAQADAGQRAPGIDHDGLPVHATWALRFIEDDVPQPYREAARHGVYHHDPQRNPAPDRYLSELVALADLLSAGQHTDRLTPRGEETQPFQQVTIFDRISLNDQPRAENYLPLAPLSLTEAAIFPVQKLLPEDQIRKRYGELNAALATATRAAAPDEATFVENLLAALQRNTWCVPNATYQGVADVSLYDHARMTAALAVCLAELGADGVKERLEAVQRDYDGQPPKPGDEALLGEPVALLVGGDISGVQDFIYTLSSKGAAKTLRGRSFYLQLLTEAVLRYVLRVLELPYTNVIYSGGGHFYLLAPVSAAQRLPAMRQYIAQTLLRHHGAALYVALDYAAAPASAFKVGRFPVYWGRMHAALSRSKQRRYVELGADLYTQVFEPQSHGGNREATCAVCGEEGRPLELLGEPDDPAAKICALCASFRELGAGLTAASHVGLGLHEPQATERGGALNALRAFGVSVQFARSSQTALSFPGRDQPQRVILYALDDADQWPTTGSLPVVRAVRYTVNRIPPMDFSDLEAKAQGIERLGVLRMDVDQLGDIFSRGFGPKDSSRATLARLATLSFQLSLFFEGWIKRLCEARQEAIYAVYAGGDDVFLIGPWDQMPSLATTIAGDLSRYSGQNPDIHLSGGLVFIHGKYPVYQAADDAADALQAAKDRPGKNAVSFLGQVWEWAEFVRVSNKYNRLFKLVSGEDETGLDGPQAILQVLRQLAQDEADKAKQLGDRPVWGPWMWHGAYQLTRMAERARQKPLLQGELVAIHKELSGDQYRDIRQWGAAARWAQLRLRKKQQ